MSKYKFILWKRDYGGKLSKVTHPLCWEDLELVTSLERGGGEGGGGGGWEGENKGRCTNLMKSRKAGGKGYIYMKRNK